MPGSNERLTLDVLSYLLVIGLLLLWFVIYLVAWDLGYSIHSSWFELSQRDFDLMNYYAMAFIKICSIMFFFLPYVSIKLTLRKNTPQNNAMNSD
jgi:hypothetical protein